MKQTNNSIFTRVLAMVLCLIMLAGTMVSCANSMGGDKDISADVSTTPDVGDKTDKDPVDNPTDDPVDNPTDDPVDNPTDDPVVDPVDPNEIFSASADLGKGDLIYGTLANDVAIGSGNVGAIVPADVKVENGASSLSLSIKNTETGSEILLGENDIAQSLDVHISGVASDNNVPMMVNLGSVFTAGVAKTGLKLYHIENGEAKLMTRVKTTNDFAIHNQYVYNALTGEVVIYVSSFSVFTAVETSVSKWEDDTVADDSWYNENDTEFTLEDVADFLGFRDLVDAGNNFDGKTVTLATDIDLNNKLFNPIGGGWAYNGGKTFNGTFDGGNHTIYNVYVNGWELDATGDKHSSTSMGAGLFSSVHNATIKNLAVVGSELVVETTSIGIIAGCAQGQCTFENIIVSDATLGNYQMRNGGIVGDIYVIESDNVTEDYSHTFKNIVVDSSVKLSSMWGDFDTGNGGVVGGKYGSSKVLMENVIVAAELDVFSDVTAAYQWYAYRRCGMLVGYTGQNSPKQATNAAADFLTCENVSVYYGDWTNYTYYQFTNQDNSWCNNYPWVRAQESPYNGPFSNVRYGNPVVGGEKINTLELAEANKTGFAAITFNQLYGGGQGVYGTNEHKGVNVNYSLSKTIYIENNLGWENLNLYYWFANGDDTWTTLVDPVILTEENGVYRIDLPAYAFAFKILADGENTTRDFYLSEVTENKTYALNFEHTHNFENNKCDCGTVKQLIEHVFTLGEDGEAGHKDSSSDQTTYTETNGDYTLSITGGSKFYPSSHDEQGNASFKLGTGNAVGKFTFTVPNDVEKVVIYVAGYKDKIVTVEVNEITYEITSLSNNGEYTAIEIDTTTTKTVSFTTTTENDERCMINTIVFVTSAVVEVHDCDENAEIPAVDPTCTESGLTAGKACSVCGKVMVEQEIISATGHTEETIPAVDATCTKNGLTEGTRCSVCKDILVEQETIPSTGHNYVEGTCSNCGEAFPTTSGTYTYVFNEYTAGTQYAKGEEHKLDENVTITTYDCHFTEELRIYSSSTNNGYAIIYSVNPISTIAVNAGNKVDTLNIYVSNDGVNWFETPITISVTSTSYKDYEVSLNGEYKYLKLDVAGSNQIRIKSITLTTVPDCAHASTTEKVVAPTCTEAGRVDIVCSSCGKVISTVVGDPATGHSYSSEVTTAATCTTAGVKTYTCGTCGDSYTEEIAALSHTTDNGVCGNCGQTIGGSTEPAHECESVCAECGKCKDAQCNEDACANKCEGHTVAPTTTTVSKSHTEITQLAGVSTSSTGGSLADKNIKLDDNITVVFAKGTSTNNPSYYSESIRVYQGGATITINSSEGFTIKTIKITVANNNSGKGPISVEGGTASQLTNLVYTITANEGITKVVITTTGTTSSTRLYVEKIEVEYASINSGSEGGDNGGSEGGETPVCEHTNTTTTTTATCIAAGIETETCDDCGETVSTQNVDALGHTTENGTCERCGETIGGSTEPAGPTKLATFELGNATTDSSSAKAEYKETNGNYTLTIKGDKMYEGNGNGQSGLKFGASNTKGSCSFVVDSNVTKVVIYVCKYSSDSTKITVNGTQYTLTSEYQAIEIIQPSENAEWTVSISAVNASKNRFYINTIEFIGYEQ